MLEFTIINRIKFIKIVLVMQSKQKIFEYTTFPKNLLNLRVIYFLNL